MGVGKTAVGQQLKRDLPSSVFGRRLMLGR